MTDVARVAGVSVATVSHAINGTRFVSEPVRERVFAAIDVTGYRRHDLARALKRARTDSVGLVVADTGHPIFAEVVHGVEEVARELGQTLVLANTSDDAVREAEVVDALRQRRVDGLLIVPAIGSTDLVPKLADDGVPVVVLDRLLDVPVDQVGVDSTHALQALSAHLTAQGHLSVAVVAGTQQLAVNIERVEVCVTALIDAGLDPAAIAVLAADGDDGTYHPVELATDTVLRHLAGASPATGFITLNAHQTVGTLQALQQAGRTVPDVGLVAFDDLPWPTLITPGITCAAQPATQIGREGMRLLARRIDDPQAAPETIRLGCELLHRQSCGCGGDWHPIDPRKAEQ